MTPEDLVDLRMKVDVLAGRHVLIATIGFPQANFFGLFTGPAGAACERCRKLKIKNVSN
jgi:hypothetical protein